jgi:hypothetical protein
VDRIADVATANRMGMQNVPVTDVMIENVTRLSN